MTETSSSSSITSRSIFEKAGKKGGTTIGMRFGEREGALLS
jgi:hypothetical protein